MNVIIFSQEQYDHLIKSINELRSLMSTHSFSNDYLDSAQLFRLMKVSKRTLQTWRSEGLIGYSAIGRRILYRRAEIEELLTKNYVKPVQKINNGKNKLR